MGNSVSTSSQVKSRRAGCLGAQEYPYGSYPRLILIWLSLQVVKHFQVAEHRRGQFDLKEHKARA